jgi:hypothetical protein
LHEKVSSIFAFSSRLVGLGSFLDNGFDLLYLGLHWLGSGSGRGRAGGGSSGRRSSFGDRSGSGHFHKFRKGCVLDLGSVVDASVLFDILQASLKSSLSLLVLRLKVTYVHEIISGLLVVLFALISQSSAKSGFNHNLNVLDIGSSINDLRAELDLLSIDVIFTVSKGNVVVNRSFFSLDL